MKGLISFTILAVLSTFSFSQSFKGGVLAGITASQVEGDTYGGYNRAGAIAGVWVGRDFNELFSLRTELKFIQKGSYRRLVDEIGGTVGYYSLRLNYAEMPFFVEYHYREDIIPFIGLSMGYLWKAIEKSADGPFPEDEVNMFRKIEVAGTVGVEYVINSRFSFCGSFSYSTFPVRKYDKGITYRWNRGQYNNVLQFYFRFHL
jgi:hypothetical protein